MVISVTVPSGWLVPFGYTLIVEAPGQTQAIIMAVQGMRHELDALHSARQLSAVTLIGIGICVGLLFAVGMIILAWLYRG